MDRHTYIFRLDYRDTSLIGHALSFWELMFQKIKWIRSLYHIIHSIKKGKTSHPRISRRTNSWHKNPQLFKFKNIYLVWINDDQGSLYYINTICLDNDPFVYQSPLYSLSANLNFLQRRGEFNFVVISTKTQSELRD